MTTSEIPKPARLTYSEYCSTHPEEAERVNNLVKAFAETVDSVEPPERRIPPPESIPKGYCFDPIFGLMWMNCGKCGQAGDHLTEDCPKPFDCPEVVLFTRKSGFCLFDETYMQGLEKRVAEKHGLKDLKDYKVHGAKGRDELRKSCKAKGGVSGSKVSLTKKGVTSGDESAKESLFEEKRMSSKARAYLKQFKATYMESPEAGV